MSDTPARMVLLLQLAATLYMTGGVILVGAGCPLSALCQCGSYGV
jgi:hypothetical protein